MPCRKQATQTYSKKIKTQGSSRSSPDKSQVTGVCMKYILAAVLFFLTTTSHAYTEDAYQMMQRTKNAIFLLLEDKEGEGGHATGFLVKYKKKNYMVTALHVCDGETIRKQGFLWAKKGDALWKLKIRKKSKNSDICLLQIPVGKGLSTMPLAKRVKQEEKVYAIGHPNMKWMTAHAGRLKGIEMAHIAADYMSVKECKDGYYHVHKVRQDTFLGPIEVSRCFVKFNVFATSTQVDPGASGGPLLNSKGQVIGVISYLDGRTMGFGHTATLKDLRKLLQSN